MKVLLTGATGYVGGRLLRRLSEAGYPVRCLARHPEHLSAQAGPGVEVVVGDVLKPDTLPPALDGIHTAFYLIHSMGSEGCFADQDRAAALNFGTAARQAGVRRMIYLGGLGDETEGLSAHLKSRHETGNLLRDSGVTVIEFRASIIIGSGSLSYEMIRSLVQRLPVMTTPRWVYAEAQPLAVDDLLAYLLASLDPRFDRSRVFEIGGADVVSYADIMREYARQRGLRRWILPVPVLTPQLSSLWLGLVTPLFARIGKKLIESVRHATVIRDPAAREAFDIQPRGIAKAIRDAIDNEDQALAETRWSDAVSSSGVSAGYGGSKLGNRLMDVRSRIVGVAPAQAFEPIRCIGEDTGWYFADSLWRLRGFMDLLVGGVGVRRGRNHPTDLAVGQVIDWWRVEAYEPGRLLRLRAEMKVPGRAWLQFEISDEDADQSRICQTAIFDPLGLAGLAYRYAIYPVHALVFRGMLRHIARCAEHSIAPPASAEAPDPASPAH